MTMNGFDFYEYLVKNEKIGLFGKITLLSASLDIFENEKVVECFCNLKELKVDNYSNPKKEVNLPKSIQNLQITTKLLEAVHLDSFPNLT